MSLPHSTYVDLAGKLASVSAVSTLPFAEDGTPDLAALSAHVARLAESQVGLITIHGSVGEWASLTSAERRSVTQAAVEAGDSFTGEVVISIGGPQGDAVDEGLHAARSGARFVMLHQTTNPFQSARGWVDYVSAVANRLSETGVILYVRDSFITAVELVQAHENAQNIVGVKYAGTSLDELRSASDALAGRSTVMCGLGESAAKAHWAAGARGFTSGVANIEPAVPVALLKAFRQGRNAEVDRLVASIEPLETLRRSEGGAWNVAVIKEALRQRGSLMHVSVRPPLSVPSGIEAKVAVALQPFLEAHRSLSEGGAG